MEFHIGGYIFLIDYKLYFNYVLVAASQIRDSGANQSLGLYANNLDYQSPFVTLRSLKICTGICNANAYQMTIKWVCIPHFKLYKHDNVSRTFMTIKM